jgi:hypothetical protein
MRAESIASCSVPLVPAGTGAEPARQRHVRRQTGDFQIAIGRQLELRMAVGRRILAGHVGREPQAQQRGRVQRP